LTLIRWFILAERKLYSMSRTDNTLRNIFWGVVLKGTTVVLPFITRTFIIKEIGIEYLGLSSLFGSVLTMLSLAEMGVSNAIVSCMYKPIAEHDIPTICAFMNYYKRAYRVIGAIILIIGLLMMPFLDVFIEGDIPSDINIYALYLIYLFNISVSYFLFAYKSCLFVANQRNDVNSRIQTVCFILQSAVQIVLLLLYRNYYCYAIVIPAFSISANLLTAYFAEKCYPEYKSYGELSTEHAAEIRKKTAGMMIAKVSSTIRSGLDNLFVSAFLGLQAVAVYSNYYYIVTAVIGFIQLIEPAMLAGIGNSLAIDQKEKNYRDFNMFNFMLQWIVGCCSIYILCLIQPFMELWVGKSFMLHNAMAALCAIYLFMSCIGIVRVIYTHALGKWWEARYLGLIDIVINLILNYAFVKRWDIYGILAATIIDIAIVSIPWPTYFLFRDYFGIEKYKGFLKFYLKSFLVAGITGMLVYSVCNILHTGNRLADITIRFVLCSLMINASYFLIYRKSLLFEDTKQFIQISLKNMQRRMPN